MPLRPFHRQESSCNTCSFSALDMTLDKTCKTYLGDSYMIKDLSSTNACAVEPKSKSKKSKDGALAGGIIGGLMVIVVLLFVYIRYFRTGTRSYEAI